jgi:hypothetical protein
MIQLCRVFSFLLSLIALPFSTATADNGNPMWLSGYVWKCTAVSKLICEREGKCHSEQPDPEGFMLDYGHSEVTFGSHVTKIGRHYAQSVAGSPLQAEVKVELADNRVLWLTPVDASRVFSDIWTGALIEPKGGVILSIDSSVWCRPSHG